MKKKDKKIIETYPEDEIRPMYHEGHKLVTRRDFLSQGFLGMSALVMMPTFGSLLSSHAFAAACDDGPLLDPLTPTIIIDLAGGAAMAGSNFMVGKQGGQLDFLNGYDGLGLPSDFHPSKPNMLNTEMGIAFHGDSGFLRGIKQVTSSTTRQKIDGTVFCGRTADDTGNNEQNPIFWLHKAGAAGELVQIAGTSTKGGSGGNSKPPRNSINKSVAPVILNSSQDALNLVSVGKLNQFTTSNSALKRDKIFSAIAELSRNKLDSAPNGSFSEKLRQVIGCGYDKTGEQIKKFSPDALDPRKDPDVAAVFGTDFPNDGDRHKAATLSKLVLDGYIGVATILMSGYDYHDGKRSTGERRDLVAGQIIGRIFELAARKKKNVVIMVITDGAVSTNRKADSSEEGRGKYNWTGDASVNTSSAMMVYQHSGRPSMRSQTRQVGYFKANGSLETSALNISNSPVNLAKLFVANYLALHGMEGKLAEVVGDNPFQSELDKYLMFDRLG